jgi:hypothetical protein
LPTNGIAGERIRNAHLQGGVFFASGWKAAGQRKTDNKLQIIFVRTANKLASLSHFVMKLSFE